MAAYSRQMIRMGKDITQPGETRNLYMLLIRKPLRILPLQKQKTGSQH
jgi:hypothetical protein